MRPFILTYFPSVPTHLAANRLTLGLYNALYGTDL